MLTVSDPSPQSCRGYIRALNNPDKPLKSDLNCSDCGSDVFWISSRFPTAGLTGLWDQNGILMRRSVAVCQSSECPWMQLRVSLNTAQSPWTQHSCGGWFITSLNLLCSSVACSCFLDVLEPERLVCTELHCQRLLFWKFLINAAAKGTNATTGTSTTTTTANTTSTTGAQHF